MNTENEIEKLPASAGSDRSCVCGAKDSPTHATDPGCWWCGREFVIENGKWFSSEDTLDINGKTPSRSLWNRSDLAERMRHLECPFEMRIMAENYQWSDHLVATVSGILSRWKEADYPDPARWLETQPEFFPRLPSLRQKDETLHFLRPEELCVNREGSSGDCVLVSQNREALAQKGREKNSNEGKERSNDK